MTKSRLGFVHRESERRRRVVRSASESSPVVVIDDFRFGNRSGILNYGAADRIDPLLLLALGLGDEVHGVLTGGRELKGAGLMEDILGALDGEAGIDRDDAAWYGGAINIGILEPEEFTLFKNEPTATPVLKVFALLVEPAGALGSRPELDALVIVRTRILARRRSPQALHSAGALRPRRNRRDRKREREGREERGERERCLY